ncbi:TauD/TfdA family dioxygenase [Streptomyces sp. NPDC056831]|uniref:TauD/TfdA family dioxygenase n=1 Tax=Streptomyces sp. NPDC056831 TaxID=3345954 RepID=UPI0036C81249
MLAHTERSSVPGPPRLMLLVCLRPSVTGGEVFLTDGQAVHDHLNAEAPGAMELMSLPGTAFYGDGGGRPAQIFTRHPRGRASIRYRQDELAQFSPAVARFLPDLRAAIAAHQCAITLSPGQCYLIDNHHYLHARSAFGGPRLCLRALGTPLFPLPPGFAAGSADSMSATRTVTPGSPAQPSRATVDVTETGTSLVASGVGNDGRRPRPGRRRTRHAVLPHAGLWLPPSHGRPPRGPASS